MFKDHIQRLKFKMGAMEVERLQTEAILKAKGEILEDQQHTIERNALLLEGIRTQLTNTQGEKATLKRTLKYNRVHFLFLPPKRSKQTMSRFILMLYAGSLLFLQQMKTLLYLCTAMSE